MKRAIDLKGITVASQANMTEISDQELQCRDRAMQHAMLRANGVLHLGAHKGLEAPKYEVLGRSVLWVEALPDIFETLKANLEPYPNQNCVNHVVSDTDGEEVDFFRSNNSDGVSSSMFNFGKFGSGPDSLWPKQNLEMVESTKLTSRTLDSLANEGIIDPKTYDFWVLDIQGAELKALRGAKESLRNVRAVFVEVSTVEVYEGGALWADIENFLTGEGFVALWAPIQEHDDVLFVNENVIREANDAFNSQSETEIARERAAHFSNLGLIESKAKVLEVGAGNGNMTETFKDQDFEVLTTEPRSLNLYNLRKRFADPSNISVTYFDAQRDHRLEPLDEQFDHILMFDVLNHMQNPEPALRYLSSHNTGTIVIDARFLEDPGHQLIQTEEDKSDPKLSSNGKGSIASKSLLKNWLATYWGFVYTAKTMPNHISYRDNFDFHGNPVRRSIFIGSKQPLSNENLITC